MPETERERIRREQREAVERRNREASEEVDVFQRETEAQQRAAAKMAREAAQKAREAERLVEPNGEGSAFRDYRGADGAVEDAEKGKKKEKRRGR